MLEYSGIRDNTAGLLSLLLRFLYSKSISSVEQLHVPKADSEVSPNASPQSIELSSFFFLPLEDVKFMPFSGTYYSLFFWNLLRMANLETAV